MDTFIIDQDADGDGVLSYDEVNTLMTNPNAADTDGDGLWDGEEAVYGTTRSIPTQMVICCSTVLRSRTTTAFQPFDTDGDGL